MRQDCRIPLAPCSWRINEGDDFVRILTKRQTKTGPPVDLTGVLAELWVQPEGGTEFLVSSNGTSEPGTSITIEELAGRLTILITRAVIGNLGLENGAKGRLDLTDAANVKTAQFHVIFKFDPKYRA